MVARCGAVAAAWNWQPQMAGATRCCHQGSTLAELPAKSRSCLASPPHPPSHPPARPPTHPLPPAQAVSKLADQAAERGTDVLINCAGILGSHKAEELGPLRGAWGKPAGQPASRPSRASAVSLHGALYSCCCPGAYSATATAPCPNQTRLVPSIAAGNPDDWKRCPLANTPLYPAPCQRPRLPLIILLQATRMIGTA
jgi:hypothetical protein